jgi:hypothetical protein
MNRTSKEYYIILKNFELFIISKYKTPLDDVITNIEQDSEDPYDILSEYVAYLQAGYKHLYSYIEKPHYNCKELP